MDDERYDEEGLPIGLDITGRTIAEIDELSNRPNHTQSLYQGQVEAQPLPDTFIKGASAFWVPMEPQPRSPVIWYQAFCPENSHWQQQASRNRVNPPCAVGDILYEQKPCGIIKFSPICRAEPTNRWCNGRKILESCECKRYTVASVEAKRIQDLSFNNMERVLNERETMGICGNLSMHVGREVYNRDDWGWYVTLTELKGEHNE